jgi:hypothetical protein
MCLSLVVGARDDEAASRLSAAAKEERSNQRGGGGGEAEVGTYKRQMIVNEKALESSKQLRSRISPNSVEEDL